MREALYDSAFGAIAVGVAVSCLMLVATVVALSRPRGAWLRDRLGAYDGPSGGGEAGGAPLDAPSSRLRLDMLYGATERRFSHTRVWARLTVLVQRAGVSISPAEALFLSVGIGLGAAVIVGALGLGGLVTLLALGAGAASVPLVLSHKAHRRTRRFDDQLPDTLQTMAGSLKVGHSFDQSVQAIVDKGAQPTADEFGRVLQEARLGLPIDVALERMTARVGSADLQFVLMSVRIQRQVGGSLAGLFETVAETVRERQQFRRKVHALTATARTSAIVLTGLPFVTALGITAVAPGYLDPMFESATGRMVLAATLVLMGAGAFVLHRIANVKG
jgi:tight adherence protein B